MNKVLEDRLSKLEEQVEWNGQQIVIAFNSLIKINSIITKLKEGDWILSFEEDDLPIMVGKPLKGCMGYVLYEGDPIGRGTPLQWSGRCDSNGNKIYEVYKIWKKN